MSAYRTTLGHVHFKVRDLARSVAFYTHYLDLRVSEEVPGAFAFLSGDQRHHEIALRCDTGAGAPDPSAAGLQHVAFEVPDRRSFAQAYNTVTKGGVPAVAMDHGISWAMYFSDPDGNTVAIYWDTRREPGGTTRWDGRSLPLGAVRILEAL
jgi:catechol 2,3-dioxygenase